MKLAISTFAGARDNVPVMRSTTWHELVDWFATPLRAPCTVETCGKGEHADGQAGSCRRKKIAAWSPATFPTGTTRATANVVSISLLVFDVDHVTEGQLIEFNKRLSGIRYLAHSSHQDRPGDRRMRYVAALSRPVLAREWTGFWAAAVEALHAPADRKARDAARLYFLPSRPADAGYEFSSHAGELLDVNAILTHRSEVERGLPLDRATRRSRSRTANDARGDDFYSVLESLDQGDVLLAISGSSLVCGQTITLGRMSSTGHRAIMVDGKATAGFIDPCGRIAHASTGTAAAGPDGGPLASTWCRHYGLRDDEIRRGLIAHVPELGRFARPANGSKRSRQDFRRDLDERETPPAGPAADAPERPLPEPAADRIGSASASPLDRIGIHAVDVLPLELARTVLRELGLDDSGRQTIVRWANRWWRWTDGHHRPLDDEEWRAMLWRTLDRIDVMAVDDKTGNSKIQRLKLGSHRVSEVCDAIGAVVDRVSPRSDLPCALADYAGPDPRRLAVVQNGLLCLSSRKLHSLNPRLFATAGAAVSYSPRATCPTWDRFLREVFSDVDSGEEDLEAIQLVHQVLGWLVAGDTTRHKIPLLVGPTRSGKSLLSAVIRGLLGEGNVCSPSLTSLVDSRFGLAPLVGRSVAIIPDTRVGHRLDSSRVAEILLTISGGDPVNIDRKNREQLDDVRLNCRLMIVSNALPKIADASGALAARLIPIVTCQSFLGREDLTLKEKLFAELPGILNRALDGYDELLANGWVLPTKTREAIRALDRLGSAIKSWVDDRAALDPLSTTSTDDLFSDWKTWCVEAGIPPTSREVWARDLRAAFPSLRETRPRVNRNRQYAYRGIRLREPWETSS